MIDYDADDYFGPPDLGDAILAYVESGKEQIHVSMPGIIQSYDPKKKIADIQPSVMEPDGTPYPIIPCVPVIFPAGGGFRLLFPLKKGDPVALFFSDRSLDEWVRLGGIADPKAPHGHDLSDAYCVPGLHSPAEALKDVCGEDEVLIGFDGGNGKIVVKKDEVCVASGNGKIVAGEEELSMKASKITITGTGEDSDVIVNGISLRYHVHPTAVGPTDIPMKQ